MTRGRKPGSLVHGTCRVCGTVELARGASQYFRCTECKQSGTRLQSHCGDMWTGKDVAGGQVQRLKSSGAIPWPSAFQCADCGKQAEQYDHRDYNQPTKVDPVCRSCNLKRGPAIPLHGSIEKLIERGHVPYVNRGQVAKLLLTMGKSTAALDGLPGRLTLEHWKTIAAEFTATSGEAA